MKINVFTPVFNKIVYEIEPVIFFGIIIGFVAVTVFSIIVAHKQIKDSHK